jgi:hypothetical protein
MMAMNSPWDSRRSRTIERSLLIESLRALALARAIEQPRRHSLDQRLNELLDRVSPASR